MMTRKAQGKRGVTWEVKRIEQDTSEQNGLPEFLMKCVNFNRISTHNLIKSGTRMQIFAQRDAPRAETDPHRLIPFLFFLLLRCLNMLQYVDFGFACVRNCTRIQPLINQKSLRRRNSVGIPLQDPNVRRNESIIYEGIKFLQLNYFEILCAIFQQKQLFNLS